MIAALLLIACTSGDKDDDGINPEPLPLNTPSITPDPITEAPPAADVLGRLAVADTGQAVGTELVLSSDGNQIAYDKTTLTATAGLIRLRFSNNASAAAMRHNVVIVKAGSEDAVGVGGISAGEGKHYLPDSDDVLGATKMLRPGESGTVVVDLPPGTYSYICTFPGHYLSMRGTLTVTG